MGTSLYDYKDTKGKYVIRELLAAAKTGGGFVEYYWIKPGEQGEKAKLGYVERASHRVVHGVAASRPAGAADEFRGRLTL